jgi:RNA recognition motif-containing protein
VTTRLYVGNLPYSATDDSLSDLFSQYGEVEGAQVVTDRETGRSRGFGFVDMATNEGAQSAIQSLSGYQMDGRTLTVEEARPREEAGAGRGRARGGFGWGR